MEKIITYILIMIVIFSIHMIYLYFRTKSKNKTKQIEVKYLERRYKLNLSKVDIVVLNRKIAFANSIIFTASIILMDLIDNFILKTLSVFFVIFILIFIIYGIIGRSYKNK